MEGGSVCEEMFIVLQPSLSHQLESRSRAGCYLCDPSLMDLLYGKNLCHLQETRVNLIDWQIVSCPPETNVFPSFGSKGLFHLEFVCLWFFCSHAPEVN